MRAPLCSSLDYMCCNLITFFIWSFISELFFFFLMFTEPCLLLIYNAENALQRKTQQAFYIICIMTAFPFNNNSFENILV